jgi:hypothetical protein
MFLILVPASSRYPTLAVEHQFVIEVLLLLVSWSQDQPEALLPMKKHHLWSFSWRLTEGPHFEEMYLIAELEKQL